MRGSLLVRAIGLSCLMTTGSVWAFDFHREVLEAPSTLSAWIEHMNASTGEVRINGVDTSAPSIPFSFDWGDGQATESFFPATHAYADRSRNYHVRVAAHYAAGAGDFTEVFVPFVAPTLSPVSLPQDLGVEIPAAPRTLDTRLYPAPSLAAFGDDVLDSALRTSVEQVLTAAAVYQMEFANNNVFRPDGLFRQVVLRDPAGNGMYSLWFTTPVAFACADSGFAATIQYSSFFHEMGHNVTLNFPAGFYYGGRIDGNANAIYSETLAQIFQHATAYELLNHPANFGLGDDSVFAIGTNARDSMKGVRSAYEAYLDFGKPFHSWNDPGTSEDETFGTFMTLAFRFFVHAEQDGLGYARPVRRMMKLLQQFTPQWQSRYDPAHDTSQAESFRATLMVAALSTAFATDLRNEFRDLNFPLDDATFTELYAAGQVRGDMDGTGRADALDVQMTVNAVLGLKVAYDCDANGDGNTNALDVQAVVNAVLGL